MQQGLLVTCPEHDDATAYLNYFSKEVIKEAEGRSLKIKTVENSDLNMGNFSKILEKIEFRLVVLNGHGSPDTIFGYKQNAIIKVGKNDQLLKERIVYARSCNAGMLLGPECMKETKNGSFVGYILPFVFFMDPKWSAKPHNDHIARLFLEPSNLVPLSIIKGHTTSEAHENAKKQMLKIMSKLLREEQEQETTFYLDALWNNYEGQVLFGNSEARL